MTTSLIVALCRSHLELERRGRGDEAATQRTRCDAQLRELAAANNDDAFNAALEIADELRGTGEPAEAARVLGVVVSAWVASDVDGRAILRNSQGLALSEAGDRRAIELLAELSDELSRQRHEARVSVQLNLVTALLRLGEPEVARAAAHRTLADADITQLPQVRRVLANIDAAILGVPAGPSQLDIEHFEWDQDEQNNVMLFVPRADAARLAGAARKLADDRASFVLENPAERGAATAWVSEATEDCFYFGDDNGLVIDLRTETLRRLADALEQGALEEINVCDEIRLVLQEQA